MNLFKKGFILLFSLLFPIIVFLFLKFYGQNEYELSVYNSSCSEIIDEYIIKDFNRKNNIRIVDVRMTDNDILVDNYINKLEINDEIEVITLSNKLRTLNWLNIVVERGLIERLSGCIENEYLDKSFVLLLDKQNRVRGHFYSADRKDIERLDVEIDILLLQYEK
tara:strand:- start:27504 stop:27998 length:495 start_codon:yes stop_codon:yes gene_type:complete